MSFIRYENGGYGLHTLERSESLGREVFESLPGSYTHRSVDLHDTKREIRNIEERPQFNPHIKLFQLKRSDGIYHAFSQTIRANDPFLSEFESFLRSNAEEFAGSEDYSWIEPGFEEHWITPYTLITCDITRYRFRKTSGAKGLTVHENLGSVDVFKGVDFDSLVTHRGIHPDVMESRLGEIERSACYSATISERSEGDPEYNLILSESKRGPENGTVEHIVFVKEGVPIPARPIQ